MVINNLHNCRNDQTETSENIFPLRAGYRTEGCGYIHLGRPAVLANAQYTVINIVNLVHTKILGIAQAPKAHNTNRN